MSRMESRVERLEAAVGPGGNKPSAVIRYNPGRATGWLPKMLADLGWPSTLVALVTIDGRADEGAPPEVVVPPLADAKLSAAQHADLAQAGRHQGPWWVAVSGRGWTDAIPMPEGEQALVADLRRQRQRGQFGYGDEF